MFRRANYLRRFIKRSIFIQCEETPNPRYLKFHPVGKIFLESGTKDFSSVKEALASPLAKRLFAIEGVEKVFVGKDYISIGKSDAKIWEEIKHGVHDAILFHFENNMPLFDEEYLLNDLNAIREEDSIVVQEIKEILETRIRPFVQEDGGDIAFYSFDEESGQLIIELKGSCDGCPSSGTG